MLDARRDFTRDEYRRRITALQSGMATAGLDALLLTTPADVFYATGFLTRFWESPARPWFVVIPAKGDPVAVIPSIGAHLMRATWISDVRTWDAPHPTDDGVSLLSETLADLVTEHGRIGVPKGHETHVRMPLKDFERVMARIAPRTVTDATDVVRRVREAKSEAEIDRLREVIALTHRAFDRVPEIVAKAPRLDTVFRNFQMALLDEGADWVAYTAGGAGQSGYGDVISPAAPEPLQSGDVLMLDTGAVKNGYFSDFDRNYSIGPLSDAARRAHETLWDATEGLLHSIRRGHTAKDAHRVLSDAIVAQGYPKPVGRLGHGLGITLTEWPSFTELDETPLVEGMVLTIEPSLEVAPGKILVHEENIVLRADGPELLSRRAPREMPEITL